MQLRNYLALPLFVLSATVSAAPTGAHASCTPPSLKLAFTANITLGKPAGNITVPAGDRIVEPIVKGTVEGPVINATVAGGVAYPVVEDKGKVQDVSLVFYGATSDGVPFFVRESGIGNQTSQLTRLEIDITGKYQDLSTSFVVGQINRVSNTEVAVCGYILQDQC